MGSAVSITLCPEASTNLAQWSIAFEEYSVQSDMKDFSKIDNKYNLPWSAFIGIAGMPGRPLDPLSLQYGSKG